MRNQCKSAMRRGTNRWRVRGGGGGRRKNEEEGHTLAGARGCDAGSAWPLVLTLPVGEKGFLMETLQIGQAMVLLVMPEPEA